LAQTEEENLGGSPANLKEGCYGSKDQNPLGCEEANEASEKWKGEAQASGNAPLEFTHVF
jgi:hypothetical protein